MGLITWHRSHYFNDIRNYVILIITFTDEVKVLFVCLFLTKRTKTTSGRTNTKLGGKMWCRWGSLFFGGLDPGLSFTSHNIFINFSDNNLRTLMKKHIGNWYLRVFAISGSSESKCGFRCRGLGCILSSVLGAFFSQQNKKLRQTIPRFCSVINMNMSGCCDTLLETRPHFRCLVQSRLLPAVYWALCGDSNSPVMSLSVGLRGNWDLRFWCLFRTALIHMAFISSVHPCLRQN